MVSNKFVLSSFSEVIKIREVQASSGSRINYFSITELINDLASFKTATNNASSVDNPVIFWLKNIEKSSLFSLHPVYQIVLEFIVLYSNENHARANKTITRHC